MVEVLSRIRSLLLYTYIYIDLSIFYMTQWVTHRSRLAQENSFWSISFDFSFSKEKKSLDIYLSFCK